MGAPSGNLTIMVEGEREAAQWVLGKFNQGVRNGGLPAQHPHPGPVTTGIER